MKKFKVIQIIPEFGLAGAEIMAENLIYELINKDIDVIVISLYNYKSAITNRLESKGVKIYYLNKKKGFDFKQIWRLYKIFKQEKPDVIHTHLYIMEYAIPAAILAKVPKKIHTVHNIAKKENGFSHRKLNKLFYRFCNVIPVSLSPLVQQTVIKEYKIKKEAAPIIYNGINLENYIIKKNYENDEFFTFLHIGRFAESKNHLGLIDSFKIVNDLYPNTKLILIGQGNLLEKVKTKVLEMELSHKVFFLGTQDTVYNYLNSSDVFILPSIYEGMPITLIEAMATGLPIITTNVGGIPDFIKHKDSGLVVELDNIAISNAMLELVSNEQLRERLGRNALKKVEKFSSEKMAEEYIHVYYN